jgi:putative hydrolases of HD superfamily
MADCNLDLTDHELTALARLMHLAGRLKRIRRQGWVDRGVEAPESVSEHSWRLALMALVVGQRTAGVDASKAAILALVHDLPETLTGDVTPFDDRLEDDEVDRDMLFRQEPTFTQEADEAKTAAEREAMHTITEGLPADLRSLLVEAWEEYEAGESSEARLVRQLDKLETWLQALEYRHVQPELIIDSFRLGADRDVTLSGLRRICSAIETIDLGEGSG